MYGICTLLIAMGLISSVVTDNDIPSTKDEAYRMDSIEHDISSNTVHNEANSYHSPNVNSDKIYFSEHFDNIHEFEKKWIKSAAKKEDISDNNAMYDGIWQVEPPQRSTIKEDLGLVLKSKAKHAAIAAYLNYPFVFNDKPLIVQYEVQLQDGQECGGSYIKLLSSGIKPVDLKQFNDKTPYTIMFGPDKCGNDIKLHFIFRHVNPLNGTITEKVCRKPKERLEEIFKDKLPHLFQLIITPDNTYTIRVDHKIVNQGSLLSDFTPSVNPPREIDDPTDSRPVEWDEREKIADPAAIKPEDWDDDAPRDIPDPNALKPSGWLDEVETMIPDPDVNKPEDWDVDMDGEWEAPLIPNPVCEKSTGCGLWKPPMIENPNYRGKWRAPLIDNPNYQGKWIPRRIANPDFYEDLHPFKMTPIEAVGIELWSMSQDILFDNILITDDNEIANNWTSQTYNVKQKQIERDSVALWERAMRYLNYKPEWWAVYFFYCSIPVLFYIWYLFCRSKQESALSWLIRFTRENPYIWLIYAVAIGLPIIYTLYACFSPKKDKLSSSKKNDDTVPDDIMYDPLNTDDAQTHLQSKKNKKTDLDQPILEPSVNDDYNTVSSKKQDVEVEEIDTNLHTNIGTDEQPLIDSDLDSTFDLLKKRKPRKE